MESSLLNLIAVAYPVMVSATQTPTEERPPSSVVCLKDLEYPNEKLLKNPLSSRNTRLPYQWNPEKRELRSSIEGLRLFCHRQVRLVDCVQSLILENTHRQASSLEDKLLEPFGHLSQLTLKGAFNNLSFLTLAQHKLTHLVLWNTRLPFHAISFLLSCIPLQSLELGRNAFLRSDKNTFAKDLFLENLKILKLDPSMSWLLDKVRAASFPQLQALDLNLDTLDDGELKFFAECKQLKALNLSVRQLIVPTRVEPVQSSSITSLGLNMAGFMKPESFQVFLSYFPHLETLHLAGPCKRMSIDTDMLDRLRYLRCIALHENVLQQLKVDLQLLQERGISLQISSLGSRL